jgi:hypothetical protein
MECKSAPLSSFGNPNIGYIKKTLMDGFIGIATFIAANEGLMTTDK